MNQDITRLLFPVRAIGNNLGKSSAQSKAIMAARAMKMMREIVHMFQVSYGTLFTAIPPQFLLSRKLIVRVAPNHHIDGSCAKHCKLHL